MTEEFKNYTNIGVILGTLGVKADVASTTTD